MLKTFSGEREALSYTFTSPELSIAQSVKIVKEMLTEHQLTVKDVKLFCTSQFTKSIGDEFIEQIGAEESQRIYLGDQFGYTGANSPFLCINKGIEEGILKRGDIVVIWTVGAGTQYIMTLLRY